jgi:membrane protease YdiL (CAAX protease family)
MKILDGIKEVKWLKILLFYFIILVGTYFARKLPNLLNLLLEKITDIPLTFNYNHGIVALITTFLFYKFSNVKQEITLLGNQKFKSILFPIVLFVCYSAIGISNEHRVNNHLWALIFCFFAFVYNLMEEYAWRGYLIDSLKPVHFVLKSLISGIFWAFWHLLIFKNFDQYGGFGIFLLFCIIFSFILVFAVSRTKSIIVAAAIHAFIIQTNIAALICIIIFILLLITWNKKIFH